MRLLPLCLAALVACAAPTLAHADTISTFMFDNITTESGASVLGTISIDVTTGKVTAGNFTVNESTGSYVFTAPPTGTHNTQYDTFFNFFDTLGDHYQLSVAPITLVGYTGSAICSDAGPCYFNSMFAYDGGFNTAAQLSAGTIDFNATGSLVATPEPSSLLLLGTGVLGLVGITRRRFLTA